LPTRDTGFAGDASGGVFEVHERTIDFRWI
jgi:hypothetical protein